MAAISIDGTPMTALPSDADQINYDNSNSRLSDTQVQDAIDTLANDSSTFVGTTTQWNNLTTAQKKAYKYRLLTDDYTDASIGNLSALHTTDKSSVVGAVNEVKDDSANLSERISISFNSGTTISDCASALDIYSRINSGSYLLGIGDIGSLEDTSLRSYLGNPNMGNYVRAYARVIANAGSLVIQIVALPSTNVDSDIKIKYVWNNGGNRAHDCQTDWQTMPNITV